MGWSIRNGQMALKRHISLEKESRYPKHIYSVLQNVLHYPTVPTKVSL